MNAQPDGDAGALRLGARRYGDNSNDLFSAQMDVRSLNHTLAEPYTFVGPAGDRFRQAVEAAASSLQAATTAFDLVARALNDLVDPVEDFQDAKEAVEKAERRLKEAEADLEKVQAKANPLSASPLLLIGTAFAADDPSTAAERRELEAAKVHLSRTRELLNTADQRKRAEVRRFVTACDDASLLAPPLPQKEVGPHGVSLVDKVVNTWSKVREKEWEIITHPQDIPGSVANGLADAAKDLVGGGAFLAELSVENSLAAHVLGMAGDLDKSRQLAAAAKFAKEHPGEFAAAVANWEGLKKDPIRWAAALAPEAVAAAATAGASAVASRTAGSLSMANRVARTARVEAANSRATAAATATPVARIRRAEEARRRMLDQRGTSYSADSGYGSLPQLNEALRVAHDQMADGFAAARAARLRAHRAEEVAGKARKRAEIAKAAERKVDAFTNEVFKPAFGALDPLRSDMKVQELQNVTNKIFGGTINAVADPNLDKDPKP